MKKAIRQALHRFVPANFHDPVGLAARLVRTRDPAALFAMGCAALGAVCTPLDLALQVAEKRRCRRASHPKHPLVFVVGAPRTGTTLAAQVLIEMLPVCFLNNLSAVFPRAPIMANLLFGRFLGRRGSGFRSYYGKTTHFSGPNDALHIWDRWLGTDREAVYRSLGKAEMAEMVRFFGAYQEVFDRPLVGKNNSLNVCAHLVAEVLEGAVFICMTRHPVYLAQSLWKARREIQGDPGVAYGVGCPDRSENAVEDVCRQVLFHDRIVREQARRIGPGRFWVVSYETLCVHPGRLVRRVSEEVLARPLDGEIPKPFEGANRVQVDPDTFRQIEQTLEDMGVVYRAEDWVAG